MTQYFFTNVSGELGLDCFSTLAESVSDEELNKYCVLEPARKPAIESGARRVRTRCVGWLALVL